MVQVVADLKTALVDRNQQGHYCCRCQYSLLWVCGVVQVVADLKTPPVDEGYCCLSQCSLLRVGCVLKEEER